MVSGRMDSLQEMNVYVPLLWMGCPRGTGSPLSKAYLKNGIVAILARAVSCSMAPGDVERLPFPVDPLEPWVLATVHLGYQPRLQPHTAGWWETSWGWLVHGKELCRRKQSTAQLIHTKTLPAAAEGPWGHLSSPSRCSSQGCFPTSASLSQAH